MTRFSTLDTPMTQSTVLDIPPPPAWMEMAEKLREQGYTVIIRLCGSGGADCEVWGRTACTDLVAEEHSDTIARAVCLAALAATEAADD